MWPIVSSDLTGQVLVPVASEEDMQETATSIQNWLEDDASAIHVLHVIEKAGRAMDKASLGRREEQAEEIFRIAHQSLQSVEAKVKTELRYATSVFDEIQATARDTEATAIVFSPRPGGRLARLLSGNLSPKLVLNSSIPVIVLPASSDGNDSSLA